VTKISGIPAGNGVTIGPVFRYHPAEPEVKRWNVADSQKELTRLEGHVTAVTVRLRELSRTLAKTSTEEAEIFDVQIEFLDDPTFGGEIRNRIENANINAEAAVKDVVDELVAEFEAIDDEYFHQRSNDIRDLGTQLTRSLLGIEDRTLQSITTPVIIVARDLSPSDTVSINRNLVLGLCTEIGSATSHTAILSRSMGIPAVVGTGPVAVEAGETVILDGSSGKLILSPDRPTIEKYRRIQAEKQLQTEQLLVETGKPVITKDQVLLEVAANVGSLDDAKHARELGADGIGLLRTEFLFLDRKTLPDEDEQFRMYRSIAEVFGKKPVTVRTLDVGGDKSVPGIRMPPEENPFLGRRAIRLSLAEPLVFRTQLRAILRAGYGYNMRIMFPMITTADELQQALEQLQTARKELDTQGVEYDTDMKVGIMVEVPSAAIIADRLAGYVDFFSIGTNDLTQYTLAVDRTNELVSSMASPFDPSVISLIAQIIRAGHDNGCHVAMCGEMAGDLLALPLLLGLGLDEFSIAGSRIPEVKSALRRLSREAVADTARRCLSCAAAREVEALLTPLISEGPVR
jgi:phosphotransferase system enzyme I (PtsI)